MDGGGVGFWGCFVDDWFGREGKCIICISVEWSIERERVGGMYNILSGLSTRIYLPIYFPSPSYLPYVPLPKKKKR